jgi:hypothetical protein
MSAGPAGGVTPIPSVGRTVHYVARDYVNDVPGATICRAAIITEVYGSGGVGDVIDAVALTVFFPNEIAFYKPVPYDELKTPGTWHWPERV